jgi:hypothetical protein
MNHTITLWPWHNTSHCLHFFLVPNTAPIS